MEIIGRVAPRLTVVGQVGRLPANRGRLLAIEARSPGNDNLLRAASLFNEGGFGHTPDFASATIVLFTPAGREVVLGQKPDMLAQIMGKTPKQIDVILAGIDKQQTLLPEMIDVARGSFRVMKSEVTVELFRLFVKRTGYKIIGHNANKLKAVLRGKGRKGCNYLSSTDGKALAEWLSKITGRKFRLPTDEEWLTAVKKEGHLHRLTGGSFLEWIDEKADDEYFLLSWFNRYQHSPFSPEDRSDRFAVRLVEYLHPPE